MKLIMYDILALDRLDYMITGPSLSVSVSLCLSVCLRLTRTHTRANTITHKHTPKLLAYIGATSLWNPRDASLPSFKHVRTVNGTVLNPTFGNHS